MNCTKKVLCILLAVMIAFSSALFAYAESSTAESDESSDVIEITVKTNKSKYRTFSTAKITVTVSNNSDSPIYNVKAQAIFNELTPVSKKSSTTNKTAECLQPDDSFTYSYKVLLNEEEFSVNLFSKAILFFKKFIKGAYHIESADNTGKDVAVVKQLDEITFGKFTAENLTEVAYSTKAASYDDGSTLTEATTQDSAENTTTSPTTAKKDEISNTQSYPVKREKMYSDDYILPSDLRYITSEDLDKFDYYEMDYVTNEIYARHGYIFKDRKFAQYFESKSWYKGKVSDMSEVEKRFSTIERTNLETIVAYEKSLGWREQDTTKKADKQTTKPATTKKQYDYNSPEVRAYSKYISFLRENASAIDQCDAADINGDGIFDLIIENINDKAAVYTYNDQYGIYELYSTPKGKGYNMEVYYSIINQLVIIPTANTGGSTHSTVKFEHTNAQVIDVLEYNNGKFETGCFLNGAEISYEEHDRIVDSYANQYYNVDGNVNQLISTLEGLI